MNRLLKIFNKKINLIFLLIFVPSLLLAATYYSQGNGNFGTLSNWNSQRDGTGSNPASINSADDYVIQNGHTITADANYTINSLSIESGGTYDGNGKTLTLFGNLTQDGTLTDGTKGAANFTFGGTNTQSISGTSTIEFDSLRFNGTGTYTIQSEIFLQKLYLASGSLNAGSNNIHILGVGTVFDKTGGSFTAGTSTFIFGTTSIGTQVISSNENITFYNIKHSPGANRSLTFSGDVEYSVSNTFERDASSSTISTNGSTTLNMSSATLIYSLNSDNTISAEWPITSSLAPNKVQFTSDVKMTADPGAGNVLYTNYLELNSSNAELTIASGTVQVNTQVTMTAGNITQSGGVFAWGSGTTTLVYNGSAQQTVGPEWSASIAPTNVEVANTSGASPALSLGSSALAGLSGNLTLTQGSIDYAAGSLSLTVGGNVVGGTGSFGMVNNNTLVVTGGTSAVTSSGQATFYNLTITSSNGTLSSIIIGGTLVSNPGAGNTITMTGSVTLNSGATLDIESGTFNMNGHQITKNGSNTLILAANTQLTTGGSSFENFTTYTLDASSTIYMNGSSTEDLPGDVNYGNIQINKSAGTVIASGSGTVALQDGADFTLISGTFFDLNGFTLQLGNNSDIIIQGGTFDFNGGTLSITPANTNALTLNSGAILKTGGTSIDGFDTYTTNGTVVFDGSTAETIPAGMTTLNNLTINNGAGVSASADFSVSGTLTLSLGTLTPATATLTGALTTNGGNFSSTAGTVVFQGASAQSIGGSSAVTFYNLTMNNSHGLTLGHDITVDGSLNLTDGIIDNSGHLLSMGTGASFSGGSSTSHVEGRVAKTFPNGNSANFTFQTSKGGQYLPVTVTFTNVSGGDYTVTVEQFNSDPHSISSNIDNAALSAISSVRYWQIDGSGGTPANLQVTLTWNSNDGISVPSALDVAHFNGSQWISIGGDGSGDANSGTIQSAVFTPAGSYFTFGDDANNGQDNSLPVTLSIFKAEASFNQVLLSWRTESEINNLGFNVYRKTAQNTNWVKINPNLISGAGNSSTAHEYQFVDRNVIAGETYSYRLESVNFNGGTQTFNQKIQTVQVPVPTEFAVFPNFPNPFNPETTLKFQIPEQQRISILIYDLKGNLIKHLLNNEVLQPGEHQVKWDATNDAHTSVSSGTYVYRVIGKKQTKIGKMVFIK